MLLLGRKWHLTEALRKREGKIRHQIRRKSVYRTGNEPFWVPHPGYLIDQSDGSSQSYLIEIVAIQAPHGHVCGNTTACSLKRRKTTFIVLSE